MFFIIDGPFGRGDLDHCQLNLKGNEDSGSITEAAVLEINEANKIRELCRALCDIPETEKGKNRNRRKKVAGGMERDDGNSRSA